MNNSKLNDYIDIIHPEELEINDTTDAPKWANYLDLRLEAGKLYIRLYDKRDEFNFHIVNFVYLNCNIPKSSAYAVLVSQFIRYALVCSKSKIFCSENLFWLLKQGYSSRKLH